MTYSKQTVILIGIIGMIACSRNKDIRISALPSSKEINSSFGKHDEKAFMMPPDTYHPETWFHFIGGNVSKEGITADLEAIADAGISGIQLFHGQFGGAWPGMEDRQITCLSPLWDDAVRHTAEECRRLGLRFTMQNCPGWAMSGGPWIEPSNSMRHLIHSRTDVEGGNIETDLPVPRSGDEDWRDYKDVAVMAFPTPEDDPDTFLLPQSIKSNSNHPWKDFISDKVREGIRLSPTPDDKPYSVEVTFAKPVKVRHIVMSSVVSFNLLWCFKPDVKIDVQAVFSDGSTKEVLHTDIPWASWQDDQPLTLACSEVDDAKTYRIELSNSHNLQLYALRLYSAARKNNWETEAGFTLRGFVRNAEHPQQSTATFVNPERVIDITDRMDPQGRLKWIAPAGKWTVLRIGHFNTGYRNAPAPPEGTGWECNKLDEAGPDAHFAGYIGRLAKGPLAGGLLNGMLLDSWECNTQTWTTNMEMEFETFAGYSLRRWFPAIFGYVMGDHETTTRFLLDWRNTIGNLFVDKFYGRMAQLAKENNMSISYETSAGDVFPADLMKYYKYADVPMCEFWQPFSDSYVGALNFKPIKPTASAARLYGKPRVAAESFTSFSLTWDEHFSMLKEVNNVKAVEGVTHQVFHTYTHNPQQPFLPPGTSFGSNIGTPFLRGQTWWKHMPEFVNYLSRCNYLLERGKSVSDILWYLGDEINHKPLQDAPFPAGFKYDYCNPDILLNRLSVRDGLIVTPDGISYRALWLQDNQRMLPETIEKIKELLNGGATVIGNAPQGIATLSGGEEVLKRFNSTVHEIWGDSKHGLTKVGKGMLVANCSIDDALVLLNIQPDVTGDGALWLHRQTDGADWYFVCAPQGKGFHGRLNFRNTGYTEYWDPVTGEIHPLEANCNGNCTEVALDLPEAGACFVVFRHNGKKPASPAGDKNASMTSIPVLSTWTIHFPSGWGAPDSLKTDTLRAWKDMDIPDEGKAFSGSAVYTTSFNLAEVNGKSRYFLDLGKVEMIAHVSVNGKQIRTLWAEPYRLDMTEAVKKGKNTLSVEVTGTWFNRLVYDANQPEDQRKTWTINGPAKDAPLRESGLLGPVTLNIK